MWDFKGQKDDLEEDGKSKYSLSRCLLGHAEKTGHRKDLGFQALPGSPCHTQTRFFTDNSGAHALPRPGLLSKSFKKYIIYFIYLAVPALSCVMRAFDLHCGMEEFLLRHAESLVTAYRILVAACGIQFPKQGSNPGSLLWEHRVLATGLPGKYPLSEFFQKAK